MLSLAVLMEKIKPETTLVEATERLIRDGGSMPPVSTTRKSLSLFEAGFSFWLEVKQSYAIIEL